MKPKDKICLYCNEVFQARRSDQKFCSNSCKTLNWKYGNKKWKETHNTAESILMDYTRILLKRMLNNDNKPLIQDTIDSWLQEMQLILHLLSRYLHNNNRYIQLLTTQARPEITRLIKEFGKLKPWKPGNEPTLVFRLPTGLRTDFEQIIEQLDEYFAGRSYSKE